MTSEEILLPSPRFVRELAGGGAPVTRPYSVVDLFCGCGGLSQGFALTERFRSVAALDNNPAATRAYSLNFPECSHVITSDIRGEATKRQIVEALAAEGIDQLDCLVGGPPCEGFSQNRTDKNGGKSGRVTKFTDDPRNGLFKWFIELAAEVKPRVVLIENVPDLLRHRDGETAQDIFASLAEAGYRAKARVLNSADYGVPQLRRRAFFLAVREEDASATGIDLAFPNPTHSAFPLGSEELDAEESWLPGDMGYWPTVREAIGDLPPAASKSAGSAALVEYDPKREASSSLRKFYRQGSMQSISNHIARDLGPNSLKRVHEIDALSSGDLAERRKAREHYHYAYARLRWAEPARTITKFVYHVGSGMFCHPDFDRSLTMREAARIQTFPDSYRFPVETIRVTSSLVGSAVPPLLAAALAREILKYLDLTRAKKMSYEERSRIRVLKGDAVLRRWENATWEPEKDLKDDFQATVTLF